jgi:predicted transcriptional regulator
MRRTNDQLIGKILETCQGDGAGKTHIVYQCNLNFKNAGSHLDQLIKAGLLEASGTSYKTTPKGMEALGHIVALRTLLGPATSSIGEEN